ncbi:ArsR family transcriptional regulator [Haloferax sp. Atlit-12N]|uniref:aryl-sulfate sulfotransferase n=1 Tax=Haloferax sp. Atlit-12N TaxID=2077203 RepID=UPI000E21F6A0|nr:aryl-sulfate sulfotransferase [Haloferax sp. Atlit-12N]RDZ65906.1 ArsR family transcriptional regulator [Haloferax sp. Atlit-12N]
MSISTERLALRGVVFLLIIGLLAPSAVSALTYDPSQQTSLEPGTVTSPANGTTLVSVQGYTFDGNTNPKKPARVVSVDERGSLQWTYNDSVNGSAWFFDVDPLPNGNLLVSSPRGTDTVVFELDPDTRERVWEQRFDMEDTHDVDAFGEDELLIANMREWNDSAGVSEDRIVVYNRTTDEITWEWYFKNHFPADTDGGYNADWSHVNDVDYIGDGRLLLSPRNFDQAIVVDMESKEIVERLGTDDNHDVLNEQHNPDWLVSENGTPTMLVADSGNNRIVEYAKEDGEWVRTWSVGSDTLNWPRDADRLPNGNTLVVDTLNHRVIEITPTGEVVWEYYATWGPYDAERVAHGDESSGPTIRDLNANGSYPITGSANLTAGGDGSVDFVTRVQSTFTGTPLEEPMSGLSTRLSHVLPWLRPVWMTPWDLFWAVCAVGVGLTATGGELYLMRRRLLAAFRELLGR